MSVCGQTEEESGGCEEGVLGGGGGGAPVREMYEQKAVSTVVRVLTVLAYLLSVSLAAILLSVYYVCVWQSPKLPPLNDTGEPSALRAAPAAYHRHHHHHGNGNGSYPHYNATRGGNITMSDELSSPPADLSSLPPSEPPDLAANFTDPYPTPDYNDTEPWPPSNGTFNATDQR